MQLPFFYIEEYDPSRKEFVLNEETSRHVVQVLRMKEGEKLNLTDGKGNLIEAGIIDAHKKHCCVKEIDSRFTSQRSRKITIAISLLKNASRFEWFLEKATEIGVSEIIPLICERTEKQKFRFDRLKRICISAMLQSQQCWLPELYEPIPFGDLVMKRFNNYRKMIAHCLEENKTEVADLQISESNPLIVVGPEGDFTKNEIELALENDYMPVSLGKTRLRSETAGVVSVTLLKFAD